MILHITRGRWKRETSTRDRTPTLYGNIGRLPSTNIYYISLRAESNSSQQENKNTSRETSHESISETSEAISHKKPFLQSVGGIGLLFYIKGGKNIFCEMSTTV